jgi:hypothetical protein
VGATVRGGRDDGATHPLRRARAGGAARLSDQSEDSSALSAGSFSASAASSYLAWRNVAASACPFSFRLGGRDCGMGEAKLLP